MNIFKNSEKKFKNNKDKPQNNLVFYLHIALKIIKNITFSSKSLLF